jgi:hypothetical protein
MKHTCTNTGSQEGVAYYQPGNAISGSNQTWTSQNQKGSRKGAKIFSPFAPLRVKFSCSACKNFTVQVLKAAIDFNPVEMCV